jgi:hypothetical protein
MSWWQPIVGIVVGWALVMATGWLGDAREDRRRRRDGRVAR